MYKKRIRKEEITVNIKGKEYTGERIITGERTMSQTIYYKGFSIRDSRTYITSDASSHDMYPIAKMLLMEIIFNNGLNK